MANSANNSAARKLSGRVLPSLKDASGMVPTKANKRQNEGKNIKPVIAALLEKLHKNEKERGILTASLIEGVFNSEVTFAKVALENYFRAPSKPIAASPHVRTTVKIRNAWLSEFSDEFKGNLAAIELEKARKGKGAKRDITLIKDKEAFNTSISNIFDNALRAAYFMRIGGKLNGTVIGPVKSVEVDQKSGKISFRFIHPKDGVVERFPGSVSSANLIASGKQAYEDLPGKAAKPVSGRKAAKAKREEKSDPKASLPIPLYTASAKVAGDTLRNALLAATKDRQAKNKDAKPATVADLPKPAREQSERMLSDLLVSFFADGKVIEMIAVETWMKANVKGVTISHEKQIAPPIVKEVKED